jgi:hypothetical protein
MTIAMQDIEDGLRELETQDTDPLRIDEKTLPLYVEIGQLRQIGEAQARAYELLVSIFEKAGDELKSLSADLRPELILQRHRSIKEEATEKAREIYWQMVERATMATLTAEFYEPNAVRQRAAFADPVTVAALVARVNAAPAVTLLSFARLAVATRDVALAAVVLETVQAREAEIPDSIAHGVKQVIGAMPLPESEQGRKLVIDIVGAEQDAQRSIRTFQTGRADVVGKIARGLRQRND